MSTLVNSKEVFEHKQRLNAFLKKRPELMEYQKEIEARMAKANSAGERIGVIAEMVTENLTAQTEGLERLNRSLSEMSEQADKILKE